MHSHLCRINRCCWVNLPDGLCCKRLHILTSKSACTARRRMYIRKLLTDSELEQHQLKNWPS